MSLLTPSIYQLQNQQPRPLSSTKNDFSQSSYADALQLLKSNADFNQGNEELKSESSSDEEFEVEKRNIEIVSDDEDEIVTLDTSNTQIFTETVLKSPKPPPNMKPLVNLTKLSRRAPGQMSAVTMFNIINSSKITQNTQSSPFLQTLFSADDSKTEESNDTQPNTPAIHFSNQVILKTQEALKFIADHDYVSALDCLKPGIEAEFPQALLIAANIYYFGKRIPKDINLATSYFKKAAQIHVDYSEIGRDPSACYAYYNFLMYHGDPTLALANLQRASDGFVPDAMSDYGVILQALQENSSALSFHIRNLFPREALDEPAYFASLYRDASDLGSSLGRLNYAICLKDGVGVKQDTEKAMEILKTLDTPESYLLQGDYLLNQKEEYSPLSDTNNTEEAKSLFKRASEMGSVEAMCAYATLAGESDPCYLEYMKKASNAGIPTANINYGLILAQSNKIEDHKRAVSLFRKAIDGTQDDPIPFYNLYLAWKAFDGEFNFNSDISGSDALLTAASLGFAPAQFEYAQLLNSQKADPSYIFYYYSLAAEQGHIEAMVKAGMCYFRGRGVEQDEAQAAELFRRAADAGSCAGQHNYAILLSTKPDVDSLKLSAHYFELAAAQGSVEAAIMFARAHLIGKGVEKDPTKALDTLSTIDPSSPQFSEAEMLMGDCYVEFGNPERAISLYEKAIADGYPLASFALGKLYIEGQGIDKNEKKGVQLLKDAISSGSIDAMLALGKYRLNLNLKSRYGLTGVNTAALEHGKRKKQRSKNYAQAVQLFQKASELGNTEAMVLLGDCLQNGRGIPKDSKLAMTCYQKAAELGNVDGMYKYALYLQDTLDDHPENLKISSRLIKRAASLKHPSAIYQIARSMEQSNPKKALAMFKEAADLGSPEAAFDYYLAAESKNKSKSVHETNPEEEDNEAEEENMSYLKKAVDLYYAPACHLYAMEIEDEDPSEAEHYYKISSKSIPPDVLINFAKDMRYLNPRGAAIYFEAAASAGDDEALIQYGLCLCEGKGVPQNKEKGALAFFKVAQKLQFASDPGATIEDVNKHKKDLDNAATAFYYYGLYVAPEVDKISYYKKAAEIGHPPAMVKYGQYLAKTLGNDVGLSYNKQALEYFQNAADLGDGYACLCIAEALCGTTNLENCNDFPPQALEALRRSTELGYAKGEHIYAVYLTNHDQQEEGIQMHKKAADHGSAESQVFIAKYLEANHVGNSRKEAQKYWRLAAREGVPLALYRTGEVQKAADLGVVEAQIQMGRALMKKKSFDEAEAYFQKASDAGSPDGFVGLGDCLMRKGDQAGGARQYKRASSLQHADGTIKLGLCYARGMGMKKDTKAAAELFRSLGTPEAKIQLGLLYSTSDQKQAFKLFSEAAETGNPEAIYYLGGCHVHGKGTEKNVEVGQEYYRKAADLGYGPAAVRVGNSLTQGRDLSLDDMDTAIHYFRIAAEAEIPEGMVNLALLLQKQAKTKSRSQLALLPPGAAPEPKKGFSFGGKTKTSKHTAPTTQKETPKEENHVKERSNSIKRERPLTGIKSKTKKERKAEKDIKDLGPEEEAEFWLKKAAELDNPVAMYDYGIVLRKRADLVNAAEMFKKASEKGIASASFAYGECLEEGKGVEMNQALAYQYYQKAAKAGEPNANVNIALCLLYGKGVKKDEKKAASQLKHCAKEGNVDAMYNYGICLEMGIGVKQNHEEAQVYLKKAEAAGSIKAHQRLVMSGQ